jgi:hypothetical protein
VRSPARAAAFERDRALLAEQAMHRSLVVFVGLQKEFGVSPEWPGFDILSLDPRREEVPDRLIELKSSGVDARMQEMSWNEWKVAAGPLRSHFFLYLVGNRLGSLRPRCTWPGARRARCISQSTSSARPSTLT